MADKQPKDDNIEHLPDFIKQAPWYMKDKLAVEEGVEQQKNLTIDGKSREYGQYGPPPDVEKKEVVTEHFNQPKKGPQIWQNDRKKDKQQLLDNIKAKFSQAKK